MKLFKDKNRGPKTRSEDVVIPEEYLEYEREAEERKRLETEAETPPEGSLESELTSDAFAMRVEKLLSTDKTSLENDEEAQAAREDETAAAVASVLENIFNDVRSANAATAPPPASESVDESAPEEEEEPPAREKRRKRREKNRRARAEKEKAPQAKLSIGFQIFLTLIVFAVAAVVVLLGPLMRIDNVQVNDLQYMTRDQVVDIAGSPVGQNLLLYRTSQAEEELRYYPYVQDAKVTRHLPHWIEIDITEREPAGVLLNNGSYLQFSKDGVLLDNTKSLTNLSLPLITGFSMKDVPSPGEQFKDNERFDDTLKIVNACSDELLTMIQEINIEDRDNILAYTSQGLEIRIGNVDDIETRMAALSDIMDQVILSGIVEEPIEAIDIRYAKSPAIVLEGYDNIDVSEYVDDEDTDENSSQQTTQSQTTDSSQNSQQAQTGASSQTQNTTAAGQQQNVSGGSVGQDSGTQTGGNDAYGASSSYSGTAGGQSSGQ